MASFTRACTKLSNCKASVSLLPCTAPKYSIVDSAHRDENKVNIDLLKVLQVRRLHNDEYHAIRAPSRLYLSHQSMAQILPSSKPMSCGIGLTTAQQVRYAHTDVTRIPSFDDYRGKSCKDPTRPTSSFAVNRKTFVYLNSLAAMTVTAFAAKHVIREFVNLLNPSARALAEAQAEINISKIPEGKSMVFKWRGKPLFVRHRTQEEIDREKATELSSLRDPQADADRVKRDEWLVVIGICTHLGCIPIANAGLFGGYYCPCHGSHYDASGRIRKGPAPLNLEVPPYEFVSDEMLIVG